MEPRQETELGLLPSCWEVAALGRYLNEAQYGLSLKGNDTGSCPLLRMTNQVNGRISPSKLQFVEVTEGILSKFRLQRGDILFNRTNSLDLVGRTAIFDIDGEFVFASYLIRLRCQDQHLDPFFLNLYLNAEATQRRLKSIATRGVSQSNISATRLRGFLIPIPPVAEQRKIAVILGILQRAIEQQERFIALSAELKNALMHKLFTEGIRSERQRQTEIGLVPESWEVVPLGQFLTESQYGLSVRGRDAGQYALLRMTNQVEGQISPHDLQYVELTSQQFRKFQVHKFDILFNRTNSLELVGRTAIFDIDGDFVFASYLIRLRTDAERLRSSFLNHYFNWIETQVRLKSIATQAVSQSNISATRLRGFPVAVPRPEDQDEIVEKVECLNKKLLVHAQKKRLLEELFHALLHQLMTAQIRVHDLDLNNLDLNSSDQREEVIATTGR